MSSLDRKSTILYFDPMDGKRKDYISWEEYFMAIAQLSARRSKDPSTQVGACIVNANKRIIGIGYNGFPIGCSDDELPWGRDGDFLDTKYPYVCHAEMNAITNAANKPDLDGASMYVSLFPCNECAKLIVQVGIRVAWSVCFQRCLLTMPLFMNPSHSTKGPLSPLRCLINSHYPAIGRSFICWKSSMSLSASFVPRGVT